MSDLQGLLAHIQLPKFAKISYEMPDRRITDISGTMYRELEEEGVLKLVRPGMNIAITAGSRQMADYPILLKTLVDAVKSRGANVFLVPAMGSHGGATAQGQKDVLREYGITEESMGVPIRATMETVKIGTADNGMDVHMDRYAWEADGIVVFNRIKAHTGFRGSIESGLMKMITIGLGKQHGASICHGDRPEHMSENIRQIASCAIRQSHILFAVGVLENVYHRVSRIAAMEAADIEERECKLLLEAKAGMPRIPFQKADILILDEIGKDISGEGMDPNITGRSFFIGNHEPFFESIAVLDITEASEGNGTGIGNADVITKRAFDKFRMDMVYPNCITSRDSKSTKIPVTMPCDKLALQFAQQICYGIDSEKGPRIVWLQNTLRLDSFYISEALLEEARENPMIKILETPEYAVFDDEGNVIMHTYCSGDSFT